MKSLLEKYPRSSKDLKYGTAGFRDRADLPLHSTFVRMGMFACLRSRSRDGLAVGVMITASHNPEHDNGIKLVDPDGGMLSQSWEAIAEELANAISSDAAISQLNKIEKDEIKDPFAGAIVLLGRDTRSHSAELAACVEMGVRAMGGTPLNLGEVTTPQLHWAVAACNEKGLPDVDTFNAKAVLSAYYSTLSRSFSELFTSGLPTPSEPVSMVLDCSYGVGSYAAERLAHEVEASCPGALSFDLRNCARAGPVNEGCGAEHVQKGQVPPIGMSATDGIGRMLASLDGDADRLVFHTFTTPGAGLKGGDWLLLDGDKIACLLAVTLLRELQAAELDKEFSFGVVQTAYANGAAGDYLRAQGVPVVLAKTGVKFVHHAALAFDVGVYFEANGHGTALFSSALLVRLAEDDERLHPRAELARRRLRAFAQCINQAVGDALSDLLAAIACLRIQGLSLQDWLLLYTDYPSRQLKVKVQGKEHIICSADETRALAPPVLVRRLDEACVRAGVCARAFVRPSGTEDVVRVYAEAVTQEQADVLANACMAAVKEALDE